MQLHPSWLHPGHANMWLFPQTLGLCYSYGALIGYFVLFMLYLLRPVSAKVCRHSLEVRPVTSLCNSFLRAWYSNSSTMIGSLMINSIFENPQIINIVIVSYFNSIQVRRRLSSPNHAWLCFESLAGTKYPVYQTLVFFSYEIEFVYFPLC